MSKYYEVKGSHVVGWRVWKLLLVGLFVSAVKTGNVSSSSQIGNKPGSFGMSSKRLESCRGLNHQSVEAKGVKGHRCRLWWCLWWNQRPWTRNQFYPRTGMCFPEFPLQRFRQRREQASLRDTSGFLWEIMKNDEKQQQHSLLWFQKAKKDSINCCSVNYWILME